MRESSDWKSTPVMKSDKSFDIRKVPVAELPEEMKKMTPDERVAPRCRFGQRRPVAGAELLTLIETLFTGRAA